MHVNLHKIKLNTTDPVVEKVTRKLNNKRHTTIGNLFMRSFLKLKPILPSLQLSISTLLLTTTLLTTSLKPNISYAAESTTDISGIWHSIDDKSGFEKAIIRINKNPNNTYSGTILKVLAQPGAKPEEICVDCPAPFTAKPIAGLNILWGLKTDSNDSSAYVDGKILDPLSGHIYSAKIKSSPDGKTLKVRGFIGFSLLGRSQIWKREE